MADICYLAISFLPRQKILISYKTLCLFLLPPLTRVRDTIFESQVLKKFNLDSVYAGQTEVDGEHFMVEDVDDGPGAFRACLDVGLSRTSTGANVFGAMKGCADGGIEIPHSEKRFPGYDAEEKVFKTILNQEYLKVA